MHKKTNMLEITHDLKDLMNSRTTVYKNIVVNSEFTIENAIIEKSQTCLFDDNKFIISIIIPKNTVTELKKFDCELISSVKNPERTAIRYHPLLKGMGFENFDMFKQYCSMETEKDDITLKFQYYTKDKILGTFFIGNHYYDKIDSNFFEQGKHLTVKATLSFCRATNGSIYQQLKNPEVIFLEDCQYVFPMYQTISDGHLHRLENSIAKRLEKFNPQISYIQLQTILKKTGGYLTGGFLLASLLETDHFFTSETDLDIFIPANINPMHYSKKLWGPDCFDKFVSIGSYNPIKNIKTAIGDVINLKNKIQFVAIDPEMYPNIPEYINSNFDLSIVTGAYTPGEFHPPLHFQDIFLRKGKVNPSYGYIDIKVRRKRISKYQNKGFFLGSYNGEFCVQCERNLSDNGYFFRSYCGHFTHIDCSKHNFTQQKDQEDFEKFLDTDFIKDQCYSCHNKTQKILQTESQVLLIKHEELAKDLFSDYLNNLVIPNNIHFQMLGNRYQKWSKKMITRSEKHSRKIIKLSQETTFSYISTYFQQIHKQLLEQMEKEAISKIEELLYQARKTNQLLSRQLRACPTYKRKSDPLSEMNCACIVCGDPSNYVFIPCGHCVTCEQCSQEIQHINKKCPICRSKITRAIRIYS